METINTRIRHLLNPEFHATGSPHELWHWMRHHAPVFWHPPSDLPGFWSFTRYKDIQTIYSNPQLFSSAKGVLLRAISAGEDPGGGITLALTDPPRHKQLRAIMSKWFTMRYAQSLEDLMKHKVNELITQALQQGHCNFTQDITAKFTLYMTCYLLGVPEEDQNKVFQWVQEAFESHKPLAAHYEFMLYFSVFMEQKIKHPSDDLASALTHGIAGEDLLAEDEILLNFENLIGATENAGLSMAGGLLAFLEHPETWNSLSSNRELLAPAIEEVLRWTSSATHSMRTVTEPTIVNGQQLEAGHHVVLWLPSANRDESVFISPEKFDITRRPNRHLALGHGEHFCIGNALARMQMKVLFSALLDLDHTVELYEKPTLLQSILVNGPTILPIHFCIKKVKQH